MASSIIFHALFFHNRGLFVAAVSRGEALLRRCGCSSANDSCLQAISTDCILSAQIDLMFAGAPKGAAYGWGPVVDGEFLVDEVRQPFDSMWCNDTIM